MKLRYIALIGLILSLPWLINAYKLSQCDFEGNYKCELIHAGGVFVPPAAFVTVWFDTDRQLWAHPHCVM